MDADIRYYRRRANEELAAANRAVTAAARERRMQLAGLFLERLKAIESPALVPERPADTRFEPVPAPALFDWAKHRTAVRV